MTGDNRFSVAVVGLGYVGLPLAVAFGSKVPTLGYDLSAHKIDAYRRYSDPSGELSETELRAATLLEYSSDPAELRHAKIIIVAVPTPIDAARRPDFGSLAAASRIVGEYMARDSIIVYESTVYPGATEEVCVPILEQCSGLTWRQDFHVGYSPERINPGDKEHRLCNIVKVVAGDDAPTLETIASLYESVVLVGVHRVSSIAVAEASKVIENTQRDLNIALMNELALIFNLLGIDTEEVLRAAGTKWNFLPFRPGLVGGHCIGVDPFYLTHKAEMLGYHPEVILAGRRINDGMGKYIAEQTIKQMIANGSAVKGAQVVVLGLTFKENCPDLRNSRVADIINELHSYGVHTSVHDPLADAREAQDEYGIALQTWDALPQASAIVLAVAHREFLGRPITDFRAKLTEGGCLIDVKSALDPEALGAAAIPFWRL